MQRKPFKQSHRLRYLLVGLLIVAVIIVATVILGQHGGKKTSETSQSTSQSSQSQNKSNSTGSTSATSSNAPVSSTDEASSVVVPSVPSSAASEAIHAMVNDGTQTPIADNQTSAPQVAASSSVATPAPAPKAVTFGNWTLANFNTVKLGSATYDQVKASYGNPTNLVASDTVTANWISTSGAKVTIVFTPTGDNKNLQLVANYKVQSGLQ